MNSVVLIGRLTRDPEVRYIAESQTAVASFSIAIDRFGGGNREKQTDFPRITVFGKQAELCERYLTKGRLVGVQGSIRTGSYKNKEGATVYTTEVVADRVEFLDRGDRAEGGASAGSNYGGGSGGSYGSAPAAQSQPKQDYGIPEGFQALEDEDIPF